ncbi:hypothetical protein QC762_0040790 [Podospora pseudocomata]|uniref:Uncharacterized protein n=1 Tax=Podospora pseudocomata TaxID=2093779 RepID=A0ABR0GMG9_9PEZI|nr:hypothetical protein QC762_0040790 [Podospora pseudocomata]
MASPLRSPSPSIIRGAAAARDRTTTAQQPACTVVGKLMAGWSCVDSAKKGKKEGWKLAGEKAN